MEEPITLFNDLERLNSEMDVLFSDMQGKDDSSASRIRSLEQQVAESRLLLDKVALAAEAREKALLTELSVYKSDNIARSAEIEKLTSAAGEFQSRVDSLSALLEEEKSGARDGEVFLVSAKSALRDKEEEVSRIWAMAEELKSESSGLKAIVKAKEAETASAEKRFLAAAAENKTLAFAIKELQGRLDAAAAALQEEKAGLESLEKQKREILDALNISRAQCSAKAVEAQKLGSSVLELEVRLDNVTRGLEEEKAGRQSLEEQKKEILAALDETRLEAAGKAAETQKLEASLVELRIRFDSVSKLFEEEKNKTRDSLILISSARSSIKDKEAEAGKIWAMLEEAKARCAELQNTLKEKAGEFERLARSRQALESELQKTAAAAAQSEQGFGHKIELLKRELRERDKEDGKTSLRFAGLEKNGAEVFTELMAAREELKSLKAIAAGNENALILERSKSRKLEQDLQLLASKARKDDAGPKIGKLLEQKDEIIANLNGQVNALENSGRAAEADHAAGLKAAEEARQDMANLLKHKEEETTRVAGRVRSLEKEAAYAEEKWRLADAQLNNAAANISERENELEMLRGRLASVESEKEHHKHAALEARNAITELSGTAGQKEGEKANLLHAALKAETERSARLLARCEETSARLDALGTEKNRLAAENEALKERGQASTGANRQELENLGRKLKNKESELESVRTGLGSLKKEYDGLLEDRKALQEKYAAELSAENAMLEEARSNITERDKLISELTRSGGDAFREAEKLKAEKESLAASLTNLKSGEDKELRKALKESEKLLRAKEQKLSRITFDLEKVKNDKNSLIEHERRLKEDLRSRPYRALLKEAEDRLLQKEKILGELNARMERVTRDSAALKRGGSQPDSDLADLLAGISHQVSNSVGIIRSNAEFCLEAPEPADLKEPLSAIVRNIISLQKKIEDMFGFSRPITLQYVDTGLRPVAEEALAAAGKVLDLSGLRVSFSEVPGLKALKADRVRLASALEQVFLNAADAMPGGGEIRVALKNDREGGQVIEIADTGGGIEPKNLSTVFHPFFTTKPGRMGLGLPLAKNIIKAHGGSIKISSTPGKGTVVSLTLPAKS